jgi:hypothetical protein
VIGAVGACAQIAEHRFEPRRRAVAEVADGAAGESRKVGDEGRPEVRHETPERLDERPIALGSLPTSIDRRLAIASAEDQKRILAEERIASHMLAAFDAFQQERVVRVLGDLQERRDRRQQVGDDFFAHRHESAAPRQFLELFKRRDSHRV